MGALTIPVTLIMRTKLLLGYTAIVCKDWLCCKAENVSWQKTSDFVFSMQKVNFNQHFNKATVGMIFNHRNGQSYIADFAVILSIISPVKVELVADI